MTLHLLSRLSGTPWAIEPDALRVVLDIAARAPVDQESLQRWKGSKEPTRDALSHRPTSPFPGATRAGLRQNVAILPISGPIFRYANMMTDHSGATSLATFAADLRLAADNPNVAAILLEIDSPGGEVTGIADAAALIRSIARHKPVTAYAEGMMVSAAYQLGAAAREIVVAPTAILGGLGIVMTVTDRDGADALSGIRRFDFVSSQTPGKRPNPATDQGRSAHQALADRLADEFLTDVALSRGTTIAGLLQATDGGGQVIGRDAVARGLADRIGSFEDTIASLTQRPG
jgi:ClpP class serine protease